MSISLSLVVIGRNSEAGLKEIYEPGYLAALHGSFIELIYIDSMSADRSAEVMAERGFKVFVLSNPDALSAAAGRAVGTVEAIGDYVLYLDSDMKLLEPGKFLEQVSSQLCADPSVVGVVGRVIDVYPDGSCRERKRRVDNSRTATSFGGFVVLERRTVVEAGNWNGQLRANEELDLYAKLVCCGKRVLYIEDLGVHHYTVVASPIVELLSLYFPIRAGRYGAFGKLLRAQSSWRNVWKILVLQRELTFFLCVLCLLSVFPFAGAIAFVLYELDLLKRRSVLYNFVVPGVLINLVFGLFMRIPASGMNYEKL